MKKVLILTMILMMAVGFGLPARADDTIRLGDKGADVKQMQQMLRTLGFLEGKADGIYGQLTQEAVDYFLMYAAADEAEDEQGMDAEALAMLRQIIRVTEGASSDEITDEQKELWPVCQPGEEANEICWRHLRTIQALELIGAGYPPQQMEILLLRRARQNWIDDMRQLYEEWAKIDTKTAKAQKTVFESSVKRLEKQWKSAEKKLKDEDLIEYLWEQYRLMEDMGVSLCFDLHTAEGN